MINKLLSKPHIKHLLNMCENLLKPPSDVYKMVELDRNIFKKTIKVCYLTCQQMNVTKVMAGFKKYLLKMEKFKPIHSADDNGVTRIVLNPLKVNKLEDFDNGEQTTLKEFNVDVNEMDLELQYDNYTLEDCFRAILPSDKEGMASFTKIGHIIHVNLREHLLPYKKIIGQILLDKVAGCKTVVNKLDMIDNTYRNFAMEVLAGEHNFIVELKENRCRFQLDFSKVYWNSRLCTEHERIVNLIKKGHIVFDVFAGVGPFAVPAASRGAKVYANDLNPESYKWLVSNAKLNKVELLAYNVDAKDFILEQVKANMLTALRDNKVVHVIMNLPALAVEFVHYFQALFKRNELDFEFTPPVLYLYCFTKGEDCNALARQLLRSHINYDLTIKELFKVRTVSSMKEMMRLTIELDRDFLTNCDKRKLKDVECEDGKEEASGV